MEINDSYIVLYYDIEDNENILKLENLINESNDAQIKIMLCGTDYDNDFISSNFVKNFIELILKNQNFNNIIKLCEKEDEKKCLENCLAIFYLTKKKGKYFTENFNEIMDLKKFILHEEMDKYRTIFNVIKKFKNSDEKYIFKNPKFYNHYGFLEGSDEINELYNKIYEERTKNMYIPPTKLETISEESNESQRFLKKRMNKEEVNEEKRIQYIKSKDDKNEKIKNILYTYYVETDDGTTNDIQRGCILENARNKCIDKLYIYIDDNDKKDYLNALLKDKLIQENYNKINFIENENSGFFNIIDVVNKSNKDHYGDIIYILRSDTIIPYQESIENIYFDFIDNKKVYGISRVERNLNGNMYKDQTLSQFFYALSQDMYIYQSPLILDKNKTDIINFYEEYSELIFNKVLENNEYEIYNDTEKYKLIRILVNDKERHIIKKIEVKKNEENEMGNKYKYNPENSGLNSIPIEHFIKQLDENEIFLVKQSIFNKFIMKKINIAKNEL